MSTFSLFITKYNEKKNQNSFQKHLCLSFKEKLTNLKLAISKAKIFFTVIT